MTPIFTMLVGLPGSGKSVEAQKISEQTNATIFSSDSLREELFGDVNHQADNTKLFEELHRRIKTCLNEGKSAIYDACNISYKRRMAFLSELKNIPCEKICVLMATPYEECLKRNAEREHKIPEHVIEKMYKNFDVPYWYEGWSQIAVMFGDYEATCGTPYTFVSNTKNYNQDNSHHSMSLGDHCNTVCKTIRTDSSDYASNYFTIRIAAMLHDCGKCFTKTFTNAKGELTSEAHYYSHEKVGSYDSLFYEKYGCNHIRVATLIRWHMQPYFWERENNEKMHNKYRKFWGEELYNDIMALHEADKSAH